MVKNKEVSTCVSATQFNRIYKLPQIKCLLSVWFTITYANALFLLGLNIHIAKKVQVRTFNNKMNWNFLIGVNSYVAR